MSSTLRPSAQRALSANAPVMRPRDSFWRRNALSLTCFAIFAVFVGALILTGHRAFNADQLDHGQPTVSLGGYLTQGQFWETIFENWESEFLQMAAYIVLTVYLLQRGSVGVEGSGQARGGRRRSTSRRPTPTGPLAGPAGGRLVAALRELPPAWRSRSCSSSRSSGTRSAGPPRSTQRRRITVMPRCRCGATCAVAVLVRVVPELAERIPSGVRDRHVVDLPPSARLAGIEAGRGLARRDGIKLTGALSLRRRREAGAAR